MALTRTTVLLCASLALAGCNTVGSDAVLDPTVPISAEPKTLESNELDRLGRKDLDAGNSGLAAEHFRAAVNKNANDAVAWIGLAAAYDELKRFDLADDAYAHAVRLQGDTAMIINNIGYSYHLRGDDARALDELKRAARLFPDNATIQNNIRLVQTHQVASRRAAP